MREVWRYMQNIITVPDGKIRDYIDGTFRNDTPEEYVRQTIERRLVDEHRYLLAQIAIEYVLKLGSRRPRADIVIWDKNISEKNQDNIKIIIECKKSEIKSSNSKDGIAQLKSYMNICPNCEWGMWTNSREKFVFRKIFDSKTKNFFFEEYNDIPSAEENISEIDRPTRKNLKNAVDDNLLFVFRTCHDHIYANDGLTKDKAFFEFLKIIFCKIEDERNKQKNLEFFATSSERKNLDGQLTVYKRITKIFDSVKKRYGKIFDKNDEIKLQPRSLSRIVGELQKYSLLNTNIDIKGKAYEEIVGANLRGDRGEFFTPRNIMHMVVDMIDPQIGENVLDSSCGTGGFIVSAMTHVMNSVEKNFVESYGERKNWSPEIIFQFQQEISEIAQKNFFGFDLNPDLVKATKMNMVMNNDGSGNILQTNSLLPPHEWSAEFKNRISNALDISPDDFKNQNSIGRFDVIVTNPPYGSKIPIDDENILKQFELAHIWNFDAENNLWTMTDNFQKSVPPEILFVERCTQFLKSGGRMGIVLPDSILGSPGLGYIRAWIIKNLKIIASLDLHADTFQPHNGTQTSVLILQKKTPEQIDFETRTGQIEDYEIFMAQVEKIGHDKRGNAVFKRDDDGNEILNDKGEKIIDDETADVAKTFLTWKKKIPLDTKIKFCAVNLSDIQKNDLRLEASVFDLDALNAKKIILNGKFPAVEFKNLAENYLCGRSKVIMADKSEISFYQAAQIIDLNPKPSGYVSKKNSKNLVEFLKVHEGQVLMTRSGTIGKVTYVSKTLDGKIFTPDLLRINAKNFPGYIYAYFKTKIGQQILLSSIYGAVIQHLDPEHLEKILIPNASENLKRKIHEKILKSFALRDESNELIKTAEKILIEELHLPPLEDFGEEKIFTINAKNLLGRFDASFHTPIVGKIVEHLQKNSAEVLTLGDAKISDAIILPGRFKRIYVEEGHGKIFIGGKQIYELDPSNKKFLSATHHEKILNQLELHENMILITCSGTIGKVTLVPKHWENWLASQHLIRIIPADEKIAGYLQIFLSSNYGRELIVRNTYGAVVDEIDDKQVSKIPVPILKNFSAQEEINSLVLLVNEKRFLAYEAEREALKIFEDEVLEIPQK